MTTPPRKMPETGIFRDIWREFNRLNDFVRASAVVAGRNVRINRTMNGTLAFAQAPPAQKAEPGVVKQYRVREVFNDYLRCREFDGTTEDLEDTLVAKPFDLRFTGWHGQTVTVPLEAYPGAPGTSLAILYTFQTPIYRIATYTIGAGSTAEHQVIVPRYIPNRSVIFASQSENETGVADVDWIDLNADGRAWARAV